MRALRAVGLAILAGTAAAASPESPAPEAASRMVRVTDKNFKEHLARAARAAEEYRSLQARADAMGASSGAPTKDTNAALRAQLRARLVDECEAGVRMEAILTARLVPYEMLVRQQACLSLAGKSAASCSVLPETALPGRTATTSLREECAQAAGRLALVAALISRGGPEACPQAEGAFSDLSPARRADYCRALLTPGDAAMACARAATAGALQDPAHAAECRALLALRGATGPKACAAAGLPKSFAEACREAFAARGDASCAGIAREVRKAHCSASAEESLAAMSASIAETQQKRTQAQDAKLAAVSAALAMRQEADALFVELGAFLEAYQPKSSPAHAARYDEYRRLRAEFDRTMPKAAQAPAR